MSSHIDDYEEYNYDADKLVNGGHSGKYYIRISEDEFILKKKTWFFYIIGKNRSKKEASEHTNHFDPSGHSRKLAAKLQNTESNRKEENLKPHPVTKK